MHPEHRQLLDKMFHPRGLAVFGGVGKPASFAHSIVLSLIEYGYPGSLYPIAPKGGTAPGTSLKIYPDLASVPGPVDLASISVPAEGVPDIIADCVKHGVAGAQVHTSGFAEMGTAEGVELQRRIVEIAGDKMKIIGPNCFGIQCPRGRVSMLPSFDFSTETGSVAMISQSGGIANDFGHEARLAGLGLSKVVSFGNGCDVDAIALLEYLADDPETEYIAAYIEGVRDARLFLETLKRTTARKPVVVWKGGLTPLGSRATVSHTGSLGGEAKIWNGALAQAGAIQVQGLDALIDALVALKYTRSRGKRIALVGGGGAIGVFSSDLAYQWGLSVPEFSSTTQAKLRQSFPTPGNSVKNPLDTGSPAIPVETLKSLIGDVLRAEPVDVLILVMLLHPLEVVSNTFMKAFGFPPQPGGAFFRGLPEALATLKSETGKDVMVVLENRTCRLEDADVEKVNREQRMLFQNAGIPVFADVHRALRGIRFAAGLETLGPPY